MPEPWTIETFAVHVNRILAEQDHRYQERFESSQLALNAAFVSQKQAVDVALISAEKAVNAALAASEKAVLKAEAASDRRFESQDEIRQQLNDQARLFMPRSEAENVMKSFGERLAAIETAQASALGRGDGSHRMVAYAIAILSTLVAIGLAFLRSSK